MEGLTPLELAYFVFVMVASYAGRGSAGFGGLNAPLLMIVMPAKAIVPVIKECGDAIKKAGIAELNYTNLEACIAAKVLTEAMKRAGRDVTRESLYRALNGLGALDVGGYTVTFGPEQRHGNRYVELAVIGRNGQFRF